MEWNIYKDWLDPVLYRQMVSMIYQLSSNADKEAFLKQERENSLFYGICERSMEEEYNLHYPGEVLERMKERRTMTKPVYRALGLALAGTSCIQETCMFNGTQKAASGNSLARYLEKRICVTLQSGVCLQQKIASSGWMPCTSIHMKKWRK